MFAPELRRIFRTLRGTDLIGHGSSDTYISDVPESGWNKYSPSYHDVFPDAASEGHSLVTFAVSTKQRSVLAGR